MNITRIEEGEIPQRYKDAGSALAKRLAAFDKAEGLEKARALQKAQSVQQIQGVQQTQQVSFAETLSQVQQAQKTQPAQKPVLAVTGLGESALGTLAASERLMARVVSGWK